MVQQLSNSSSGGSFPTPSASADINNAVDYLFPEMLVRFYVNHISKSKTVDIELKLVNIKVDEINAAIDRLATYLKTAIAEDMNPGATIPEGTVFQ